MAEPPVPTGSASPGHTFEHDLKAIREENGVALDTLQTETRLPLDILERFESGRLTGDDRYNEVYIKALLRAYADAIGVPVAAVLAAYAAQQRGQYRGELRDPSSGAAPPATLRRSQPAAPVPAPPQEPPLAGAGGGMPPSETTPPPAGVAPAVAALSGPAPAAPPPPTDAPARPNEHFAKSRVQSEAQARGPSQPIDRSWGLVIGGAVAALVLIGVVLFLLFRDTAPELEADEDALAVVDADTATAAASPADTASGAAPVAAPSDAPRLQVPIAVTVVAAGGPLQNFRVEEVPDARRPYWLEQGQDQTFTSSEAVVVWGTESGGGYSIPTAARLRLQGYEWSPRAVQRIDAARGQALLDSLHRAGAGRP